MSRPCPACTSTRTADSLEVPEMMFGLDETFTYDRCADCDSLFIRTVPETLADYYSTKYYSFDLDPESAMGRPGVRHGVAAIGRSVMTGRDVLGRAARVVPVRQVQTTLAMFGSIRTTGLPRGADSRVLDVGCGSGALVYAMSLAGLDVTGVDPFNAEDRTFDTGARVLARDLAQVDGSFELVMLHHSFEHVPSPGRTLAEVRRVLAPGGRVLIRMPTVSSTAFERYGTSWMQLDPPRHLTVFSRQGMSRLCEAAGLRVDRVHDDSTAFQFWTSEQVLAGTPLVADDSHFVDPGRSAFSRAEIRTWEREAARLNEQGRGDQAAWVLTQPVAAR